MSFILPSARKLFHFKSGNHVVCFISRKETDPSLIVYGNFFPGVVTGVYDPPVGTDSRIIVVTFPKVIHNGRHDKNATFRLRQPYIMRPSDFQLLYKQPSYRLGWLEEIGAQPGSVGQEFLQAFQDSRLQDTAVDDDLYRP